MITKNTTMSRPRADLPACISQLFIVASRSGAREMGWQERADAARNRRELEHRSAGKALGLVRI